ncbi:F0F1 ATP synthase subunit B family protein [Polymorphobacter sp.]|uniref:F0F1 ATP synthase subunit B family protein n=1 Tax=Polymorphobacter sp. TaxID=1909290 RepID=UPI003F70FBEF
MPQFDPSVFIPQLVWLAAIFALLYFVVVRPTLPKVGRVIEARETRVASDLDAAEAAKGQADTIRTRYDEGMAAARKSAQAEVAAAKDAAARAAEKRLAVLAAELDARTETAVATLNAARTKARQSLATSAADLTADAVRRIAGIEVQTADVTAALQAAAPAGDVRNG